MSDFDLSWLPQEGELVAERYRVSSVIGAGGMGAVVAAVHEQLGTTVALKLLRPSLDDDESIERFFREARATSKIRNDHVVKVWDVGRTRGGIPFLAMEMLEGEDLGKRLMRAPLPLELAIDCVLQAAEGLKEAHAAGIVHRDIKPSNLWLSLRTDGTPSIKVLDFGISKVLDGGSARDGALTATNAVFGSPMYMSPEQIRSSKRVDARTDVWALGVVLFELLTQRLPFDAESVSGVLASVAADPPIPLCSLRPEIPREVEVAIVRCLEKDPTRRATLEELADRLAPFGSTLGMMAAGRISGSGRRLVPSQLPVSIEAETSPALSQTDQNLGSSTDVSRNRSRVRKLGILGAAAFVAATVAVFAVSMRVRSHANPAAAPTTAASDIPKEPVVERVATSSSPSALPVVVPTNAPSASAKLAAPTRAGSPRIKPNAPLAAPTIDSPIAPAPAPVPTVTAVAPPVPTPAYTTERR